SEVEKSGASLLRTRSRETAKTRTAPAAMPRPSSKSSPYSVLRRNLRVRVGDHRAQLLAGLEDRHRARRYFAWITRPRVTRPARHVGPGTPRGGTGRRKSGTPCA